MKSFQIDGQPYELAITFGAIKRASEANGGSTDGMGFIEALVTESRALACRRLGLVFDASAFVAEAVEFMTMDELAAISDAVAPKAPEPGEG